MLLLVLVACRAERPSESGVPDTADPVGNVGPVYLNELMASNHAAAQDPTGGWPDWIELYNPSAFAIALDGWTVSDDPDGAERHALDGLQIEAGGWLVLWADGEPMAGPDHLPLRLEAAGETVSLYGPDGAPVDGLSFGELPEDVSLGRSGDGAGAWTFFRPSTPGASNGVATALAPLPTPEWPAPGPACWLGSNVGDTEYLEGDAVSFVVHCTGPLATEAPVFEVTNLPAGASFDDASLSFSWPTGAADAARVDVVFAVRPADDAASIPSAGVVRFEVVDDPFLADAQPVTPATYPEEWGLPVVHLEWATEPNRNTDVDAIVTWDGRPYPAGVQVHGRTSTSYPKLSYVAELREAELPMPDWGGQVNHLLLISTFDDNSYVRQKLAYETWAEMAEQLGEARLTPRSFFTVVYINGSYQGLYLAVERIDDEFLDHMGFDRDANLYKAVDADANFALTDVDGVEKETLHQGYEKQEGEPEDDFSDLDALVAFTGASTAQELVAGADAYFDLTEFMDWWLLVFYAAAEDTTCKNAYLAATDGGFHAMPWDFNASWGQNWRTYRVDDEFADDFSADNRVFSAIMEDAGAQAEVWERYRSFRDAGPFALDWQESKLDEFYALIDRSAARDWQRWGEDYESYEGWAAAREEDADLTDYDGEKAYVYEWVADRARWMSTAHP